jgi:hypothetical protein
MVTVYFHQTLYRRGDSHLIDGGSEPGFFPYSSSIGDQDELAAWNDRVRPWLCLDESGPSASSSLFYGVFGTEAVLIRRQSTVSGPTAHLLIGPAANLTLRTALELRGGTWALGQAPPPYARLIKEEELGAHRSSLEEEARSSELAARLTLLMSRVLAGPRTIVAPSTRQDLALMWGICDILEASGENRWTPGFETFDDRAEPPEFNGLFLRFRKGAPGLTPVPETLDAARTLVSAYGGEGPAGVRRLADDRVLPSVTAVSDPAATGPQPVVAESPRPRPPRAAWPAPPPGPPAQGKRAKSLPSAGGAKVTCPICLGELDWGGLELCSYDLNLGQYVPLFVSEQLNERQLSRLMRTAWVQCPNPGRTTTGTHHLPAAYGEYGRPIVLGLVGRSSSGKTHLLSAMIGAIEQGDLAAYGLSAQPIDLDRHRTYVRTNVRRLLESGEWLPRTDEGVVQFVDAFVISDGTSQRPMALFDVAGGDLMEVDDAKRFLDIADGLLFVVDPQRLSGAGGLGDPTFSTVLDLLRSSKQLSKVSAAIVLGKADLLRFEDPISYWLRQDGDLLDPVEALEESKDVYAYLCQRGARAWVRPYHECLRATLHVASATGTSTVERGVRPLRVLKPLVALMAMTGLIPASAAETMGI